MVAQLLHPREEPVCPFYAFQGDGTSTNRDGRLSDIQLTDCARGFCRSLDVAQALTIRLHAAQWTGWCEEVRRDFMGAYNLDATAFDEADDRSQKTVVALRIGFDQARQLKQE